MKKDLIKNNDLCRKIIINHYCNSLYKKENFNKDKYKIIKIITNGCNDNFLIGIIIKNNIINQVCFKGNGCVISTASIDICLNEIINKSVKIAIKIIKNYLDFILKKSFDFDLLNDFIVFLNVNKQPSRINCALIGPKGIYNFLINILNL